MRTIDRHDVTLTNAARAVAAMEEERLPGRLVLVGVRCRDARGHYALREFAVEHRGTLTHAVSFNPPRPSMRSAVYFTRLVGGVVTIPTDRIESIEPVDVPKSPA